MGEDRQIAKVLQRRRRKQSIHLVSAKQGVKETLSAENTGEAPNILRPAGISGKLFSIISYSSQTHHPSLNLALCT